MLDRFRPELLAQVLEHHDLSDRHQQRRALYSCCFVSRYVSDVAQPALWKRIEVYDFWQAKSVIAGKDDETRALATRELEITCPEFDSETETIRLPIASLLEALPRIRKLAFRGKVRTIQDDEALAMNGLTSLSHLALEWVVFSPSFLAHYAPPPTFRSLSIVRSGHPETFAAFAAKLVNLKSLHCEAGGWGVTTVPSPALLTRLDRVYLCTSDFIGRASRLSLPTSNKILYRQPYDEDRDVSHLFPHHITLELWDYSRKVELEDPDFDELEEPDFVGDTVKILQQPLHLLHRQTPLRSISLPPNLRRQIEQRSEIATEILDAYDELLRAAAACGVEVRWFKGDAFEDFGQYLERKAAEGKEC